MLVLLLLLAAGCNTDPYTACMKGSLDVSNAISGGITVIVQLKQDGTVNAQEEFAVLGYFQTATTLNQAFRNNVRTIHSNPQAGKAEYIAAAQTFLATASDPTILAAVHVTNPASELKVQTAVKALQTALTGIQTAINAATGA